MLRSFDRSRICPVGYFPHEGPLAEQFAALGIPVQILPPPGLLRLYGKRALSGSAAGKLRLAFDVCRYGRQLAAQFRRDGIGLLHCNQTRSILQAGLGARLAGIPAIWCIRISEPLPGAMARLAERWSVCVLGVWPGILDELPNAASLRGKFATLVEQVDSARFSPAIDGSTVRIELGQGPEDPILLVTGILHPRKRHDLAIRAMPQILQALPTAKLVIAGAPVVGEEAYAQHLGELVDELALGERVLLAGRREDVPELLAAADVFILSSEQEGLSVAVIEAMMSATPVVATPQAGRPMQDGVSGIIVREGDAEALAEAVTRLLGDRELCEAYGRAGRERAVAHWSAGPASQRLQELYERMAAGHGLNSPDA